MPKYIVSLRRHVVWCAVLEIEAETDTQAGEIAEQLRADGKLGLVDLIDETITYPTAEGYPWHHEGEYLEFLHITDSKEFEQ